MKIDSLNPPQVPAAEARQARPAGGEQTAAAAPQQAQPSVQGRIVAEQQQLNRAILTSWLDASLSVGNDALGLLYKCRAAISPRTSTRLMRWCSRA